MEKEKILNEFLSKIQENNYHEKFGSYEDYVNNLRKHGYKGTDLEIMIEDLIREGFIK